MSSTTLSIFPPSDSPITYPIIFKVIRSGSLSGPSTVLWTSSNSSPSSGEIWFGGGESIKEIWINSSTTSFVSVSLNNATGSKIVIATATYQFSSNILPKLNLEKAWDFTTTSPTIWTENTPLGDWKTNCWFGSDGAVHNYNGSTSIWPDSASSRSGGNDLQTYSDLLYNGIGPFSQSSEGLIITANTNPVQTTLTPNPYTGGILTTERTFAQRYGMFLFKGARLGCSKGGWPGLWLLGLPYTEYDSDEIDIAEALGGDSKTLHFNAHLPRLGFSAPEGIWSGDLNIPHDIGLLWTPSEISWLIDGKIAYSIPNPPNGWHEPMYLLVDLAVGPNIGGWAGVNLPPIMPSNIALAGIEVSSLGESS